MLGRYRRFLLAYILPLKILNTSRFCFSSLASGDGDNRSGTGSTSTTSDFLETATITTETAQFYLLRLGLSQFGGGYILVVTCQTYTALNLSPPLEDQFTMLPYPPIKLVIASSAPMPTPPFALSSPRE